MNSLMYLLQSYLTLKRQSRFERETERERRELRKGGINLALRTLSQFYGLPERNIEPADEILYSNLLFKVARHRLTRQIA